MANKQKPYTENELLEKLKQYCPDFKVGIYDIRNPTPEFVNEFYRRILIEFNVDISSLVQTRFNQMEVMSYHEMFQDIIPVINLMQGVKSFGVIPDFSIMDLVQPVPKRNLHQMSAFMKFVEFSDLKIAELHDTLKVVGEKKTRKNHLLQKIDEMKEKKNKIALQRSKMLQDKKELEDMFLKLTEEQKCILNEKENIVDEINLVKTTMNEKLRCVEKLEKCVEKAEEDILKVKSQIVVSPTSIITDMEALHRKVEEKQKMLENVKDKLQSKKTLNARLIAEQNKQQERLLKLTNVIDLIHKTQTNKKDVENKKKTLSKLMEELSEEEEIKKNILVKIETQKEEISNMVSGWEAEKVLLDENKVACKREYNELELKKKDVLNFMDNLKNIEVKIGENTQEVFNIENIKNNLFEEEMKIYDETINAVKNHMDELEKM